MVPEVGLEPTRPQWPRDFKSLVSTDSTIQACGLDSRAKIQLFDKMTAFAAYFSFTLSRNSCLVRFNVWQIQQGNVCCRLLFAFLNGRDGGPNVGKAAV